MARTWVTDLTHFMEDGRLAPGLPGPARKLAEHLTRIVAAVTGVEPDAPLGVRCRARPGRRACGGEVDGYVDPETNAVHWACPDCGDDGLISNWEGTIWDLRDAGEGTRH